jgi:hypothetical protein
MLVASKKDLKDLSLLLGRVATIYSSLVIGLNLIATFLLSGTSQIE